MSLVKLWWKVCFWQPGQPYVDNSAVFTGLLGMSLLTWTRPWCPSLTPDWEWHPVQVLVITERGTCLRQRCRRREMRTFIREVFHSPHMEWHWTFSKVYFKEVNHALRKRGNVVCRTKLNLMGFFVCLVGESICSLYFSRKLCILGRVCILGTLWEVGSCNSYVFSQSAIIITRLFPMGSRVVPKSECSTSCPSSSKGLLVGLFLYSTPKSLKNTLCRHIIQYL